jgi:4-diphosphocytidyl-2-C-methyl-D-erythritol kinase
MATRVRSYSKINLGLAIGPVRADGFHSLATLYQTLELHDVVTVKAKPMSQSRDMGHPSSGQIVGHLDLPTSLRDVAHPTSRITLTTNHPDVPADERNTAWKMVERALVRMGVAAEVSIHIQKELPVQGGLGAGSANAAATLIGLERELGTALPEAIRLGLAAEVGSDVPLFLIGGAVLGTGRGERVTPMPDLPATWCVVAVPEVGVSTPRAFQEWDALCEQKDKYRGPSPAAQDDGNLQGFSASAGLTSPSRPDRLELLSHVYASVLGGNPAAARAFGTSGIVRGPDLSPEKQQAQQGNTRNDLAGNPLLALVRTGIENDFEQVVFPQYPLLREIKHELMGTSAGRPADFRDSVPDGGGAMYAALSGSGSALFGLYRTEADAEAAQQRVQASGCKAILTRTLPREEYWRRMFAE